MQAAKGKWRYASSQKGNGDLQAAEMEICKQQSDLSLLLAYLHLAK